MRSDMRQHRRRRNSGGIPTWLYIALIAVMAAVFCVSAYFLIDYIVEQNNAALSYNKLATSITRNPDAELPPDQSADGEYIPPIIVDHAALSEINPNYSFWLHLEDSVISYPVVSNVGNSYYLSHLFSGENNANGCLFTDEACTSPLAPGRNTLVHGHRMNSGNMFGTLSNFLKEDYALSHSEFYITSPKGNYRGRVFSAYLAEVGGDYTTMSFSTEPERENYIKAHIQKSAVDFGVQPFQNAPIVTLATCVRGNSNQRMIVMMTLEEIE